MTHSHDITVATRMCGLGSTQYAGTCPFGDRRTFLKGLAAASLGGSALSLLGCAGGDSRDMSGAEMGASAPRLTRPVLLPWRDDVMRIVAPSSELPVTYVSMALRQVFVDHAFRDRASWLLDAHISVSTAHWRIPLSGDPAGLPIPAGDSLREFEELSIRAWDPYMPPAQDDIRIRRGQRVSREVHFDCIPGSGVGGKAWFSAGPWPVDVCDGSAVDTTREDFGGVGSGVRHRTRACEGQGDTAQYVMWACRS